MALPIFYSIATAEAWLCQFFYSMTREKPTEDINLLFSATIARYLAREAEKSGKSLGVEQM